MNTFNRLVLVSDCVIIHCSFYDYRFYFDKKSREINRLNSINMIELYIHMNGIRHTKVQYTLTHDITHTHEKPFLAWHINIHPFDVCDIRIINWTIRILEYVTEAINSAKTHVQKLVSSQTVSMQTIYKIRRNWYQTRN